jgi:glycosyltransferase involved in cell wall biosynthesis
MSAGPRGLPGDPARPRIHWVSPLPPAETDIAHYTARILPALAARAEVVLWTDAERWDPALERHALVRRYDLTQPFPLRLDGLPPCGAGVEAVFIHIGNSPLFHAGPLALARQVPACVVFHDIGVQDLMGELIRHHGFPARQYLAEMARWYGLRGRAMAERMLAGEILPTEVARTMPGFEIALDRAVAGLSHTAAGFDAIAARATVPAWQLDLPYAPGPDPGPGRAADGPLRLVQFGYIGRNRRLPQVLEALARLRGRVAFRLDIIGTVWDSGEVRGLIAEHGLAGQVHLRGHLPEAELDAALAAAHLVFNLRNPSLGEASGSQLRIWNASAASVVSDLGWYAELAADCAFRVPAEDEVAALAETVAAVDADRARAAAVGAAGRARLLALHGPERYAQGLIEAVERYAGDAACGMLADAGRRLLATMPAQGLARRGLTDLLQT